jgi:Ca2+-binding RTX toxin-like protein
MPPIVGNNSANTLSGTSGNDEILGLGGNDRLIGTIGNDILNGGDGNDIADYRSLNENITLTPMGGVDKNGNGRDQLIGIETIWGNTNRINTIDASSVGASGGGIDVDLSTDSLKVFIPSLGYRDFTVKNFSNIIGTDRSSRFVGNYRNNQITGGASNDYIVGSRGNDTLNGGGGNNTLDYSNLGNAVKILPRGTIAKGAAGTDKISNFSKIIGAANQTNAIDASVGAGGASLNVNLANNSLGIIFFNSESQQVESQQFEVVNFVNVFGTGENDTIIGGNKNSTLTGGGGNDSIVGGTQNDKITGADRVSRGDGQIDTLTGGGGANKFILGDSRGAYYRSGGAGDFATITDFNIFGDSIDVGNLTNYSFGFEGLNTINLFAGSDVATRDLIAKIKVGGFGGSEMKKGASSKMAMMAGDSPMLATASNSGLSSLSGQINILSGANSIAEAIV